jgi:hypothetical protein
MRVSQGLFQLQSKRFWPLVDTIDWMRFTLPESAAPGSESSLEAKDGNLEQRIINPKTSGRCDQNPSRLLQILYASLTTLF